jgi:hypothetical protein
MSTVPEIEQAIERLPAFQRKVLLQRLMQQMGSRGRGAKRSGLKAAAYPPLSGLPGDLSVDTGKRVKLLVAKHHAANR